MENAGRVWLVKRTGQQGLLYDHFREKHLAPNVPFFTGRLVGLLPTLMILHGREMPRDPRRLVRSVSACFPPRPGKAFGVGASYRDAIDVAGRFAAASRSRCYRSAIVGFRKPARRVLCPASRGPLPGRWGSHGQCAWRRATYSLGQRRNP